MSYRPEPGDVMFVFGEYEDNERPYYLDVVDDTGTTVERHEFATTLERGDFVAAWRESQARREEAERLGVHPLEIEFAPFGPAWQREQEERR